MSETGEEIFQQKWKKLLDPSHMEHEEIIWFLQTNPNPLSVPYLRKAIELKPSLEYLDYDDYGAYYKRCLWALSAINTEESIVLIRECAESDIPELKDQAIHRLKRISEKS